MKEAVMRQSAAQTRGGTLPKWFLVLIAFIGLAVVGGLVAYRLWTTSQVSQAAAKAARLEQQATSIEEKWGLRVNQIVVTADGGLIDLRFQVSDPAKTSFMYDDVKNLPKLIAPDGTEIALNKSPHSHHFQIGSSYFIIYRNIGGSVMPGDLVKIQVGDLVLDEFRVLK